MYHPPSAKAYSGRESGQGLYFHEKVRCLQLKEFVKTKDLSGCVLLGYACDEGVRRNKGRTGAFNGPEAIRLQFGKHPMHLPESFDVLDIGTWSCTDEKLEDTQAELTEAVSQVLAKRMPTLVLGGGHDLAYGHFSGIRNAIGPDATIGIINFDAHLDLREPISGANSGTPFFQIAEDESGRGQELHYLCLGMREDANDKVLVKRAGELGVQMVKREEFYTANWENVKKSLKAFIERSDHLYVTIDLDGFTSAIAPGVSAASPNGFTRDIVILCLESILKSGKVTGLDLAEMNPEYDVDEQTAKLAAGLLHYVIHQLALL